MLIALPSHSIGIDRDGKSPQGKLPEPLTQTLKGRAGIMQGNVLLNMIAKRANTWMRSKHLKHYIAPLWWTARHTPSSLPESCLTSQHLDCPWPPCPRPGNPLNNLLNLIWTALCCRTSLQQSTVCIPGAFGLDGAARAHLGLVYQIPSPHTFSLNVTISFHAINEG